MGSDIEEVKTMNENLAHFPVRGRQRL
jgi:hypothetical protein